MQLTYICVHALYTLFCAKAYYTLYYIPAYLTLPLQRAIYLYIIFTLFFFLYTASKVLRVYALALRHTHSEMGIYAQYNPRKCIL